MASPNMQRLIELMTADVDPQELALSGVWYEPRSLWEVKSIVLASYRVGEFALTPVLPVRLNRNNFRNGTRYPITINRMAVSGIGYPFVRPDVPGMQAKAGPGPAMLGGTSMINRVTVDIRVPWRAPWSQSSINTASMSPQPTSGPEPAAGMSSLFGNCALQFDKTLVLPTLGALEFDVSSLQGLRWANPAGGAVQAFNLPVDNMTMMLAFLEANGILSGTARSLNTVLRTNQSPIAPNPTDAGYPYALPEGFVPSTAGGPAVPFWDGASRFTADAFKTQNATRAGATAVYGMSAMIDQIAFDETVLAAFANATIAPVSTRIGTRIRCVGGVGGDYWWRPGAPMCLVMDTTTPAAVYYFDKPITLAPGDSVEVTVNVPTESFVIDAEGNEIDGAYAASYQIGVSLNGYTAIDG